MICCHEARHTPIHNGMTNEEFIASGQRIFGKSGWQRQLAKRLGRDEGTVSRYAKGRVPIPEVVALAMRGLEQEIGRAD